MKRPRNSHLDHQRREGVVVEEQGVSLREGELARAHQQLLRHLEAGLVQQLRSSWFCYDTVSCAKDGSKAFTVSVDRCEDGSLDLSLDLSFNLSFNLSLKTAVDTTI